MSFSGPASVTYEEIHELEPDDFLELIAARALRPRERLGGSEWADRYRVLTTESGAVPGPWRTDRVPYMRDIMDALADPYGPQRVCLKAGAQIGKTEVGNNWCGYIMDQMPGPMLFVLPTVELAKRHSKQRLETMIEQCPVLRDKVSHGKRDKSNTISQKQFPGGVLLMTGANSGAGLRSTPVRYVYQDEIDAYPPIILGEGSPVDLAIRGTRTFGFRRRIFYTSTPTIAGRSEISRLYEESDRSVYLVPCPFCEHYQRLYWTNDKGRRGIQWDGDDPAGSVHYVCEQCERKIPESAKEAMVMAGRWEARNPEKSATFRGFWVSALYTLLGYSWGDAVTAFLEAKDRPMALMVWVNQTLGEEWMDKGESPPWETLYRRRESYEVKTVPPGVAILTQGVDIQADRVEYQVLGWGPRLECWVIDWGAIPGSISEPDVQRQLREQILRTYPDHEGWSVRIRMTAVDAGYATGHVSAFCKRFSRTQVMAVIGRDAPRALVQPPRHPEVRQDGKRRKGGARHWVVGTGFAKQELYANLLLEPPLEKEDAVPPGFVHFPELGQDYFRQLCSHRLVREIKKDGRVSYRWIQHYHRDEALDTFLYGRAAAGVVGIDRYTEARWEEVAREARVRIVEDSAPLPAARKTPDGKARTRPRITRLRTEGGDR